MATLPTHAFVGCALVRLWPGETKGWPLYATAAALALLPDADVIGLQLGVEYGDPLGHRGLSHSLAFAACAGTVAAFALRRRPWAVPLVLVTATHGLLDALTNGGLGVAFFAPFSNERYFLPWRPLWVSPIGLSNFFCAQGADALITEALWVWLPLLLVLAVTAATRASPRSA